MADIDDLAVIEASALHRFRILTAHDVWFARRIVGPRLLDPLVVLESNAMHLRDCFPVCLTDDVWHQAPLGDCADIAVTRILCLHRDRDDQTRALRLPGGRMLRADLTFLDDLVLHDAAAEV